MLTGGMTGDEAQRCSPEAGNFLESLSREKRVGKMSTPVPFCVAAERWRMLQASYPDARVEPALRSPDERMWEQADAIRELVRGRIEVTGPITVTALADLFRLPNGEIEAALLALESEGFVLRGKFHPNAQQLEWCDRRLLARIHRLTINRLRAEIQPVTLADFHRFLVAWQRADSEHRVEGPEGTEFVLELLDGYEIPAAAWEPHVLAARVKEYDPHWLDRLCFTGAIGWGRLSPPQNRLTRAFAPLRSSPISLFLRENLPHWLHLSDPPSAEFSSDTREVLNILLESGALFFRELVSRTKLLPSRVEQALGELASQGWVTADSFDGLRALLVPSEKRAPFADLGRKRHHKPVTSIASAGRCTLLRRETEIPAAVAPASTQTGGREQAVEVYALALLRRYGVMFRRLLGRESLSATWFELGRVYRRLEARGEIRGGYFVSGVSGEQFARPEAIGLLRGIRKKERAGELVVVSAADPLNLVGVLSPGGRVPAFSGNRILLRDGVPIAALEGENVRRFDSADGFAQEEIERALIVGKLPASLRPYYS